jgi:Raf kinase inhibitor-like YbhB/YbcL family protein
MESAMTFRISSPAFSQGATIPTRHTCSAENVSPPLVWSDPPEGTRSLALILDDPDAPGKVWVHWLAWNIPSSQKGMPEGVSDVPFVLGTTDFGKPGYGGPCPPRGHGLHRYFFRLYALDAELALPRGASRPQLDQAMAGHVLATAETMGRFSRD